MGYSANNTDTGALYFGSINPTVTGQEVDNDSFIVTSNGLSSGTPISFWKFDEETLTWVQVPSGNPVTVVDNIDGTVTVNAGGVNIQAAQRPILEMPILARNLIDPSADYDDVWDASAGRMVRVLATRASQVAYRADGLNDTRVGDLGSVGSRIYAVFDHIHPILAITAPAAPILTVGGGALTITQSVISTITEEESVTFNFSVTCNIPIHTNTWQWINIPNIAGFKQPISSISGMYRQSGNPTGFVPAPAMINEFTFWTPNLLYIGGVTENQATIRHLRFSLKYVIS